MVCLLRAGENVAAPIVPERKVLIRVEGQIPQLCDVSFLMIRIDGPRWVVSDADGLLTVDDPSQEEVIPLAAGGQCPAPGRPFLIIDNVTKAWMAGVRGRARVMAEFHGVNIGGQPAAAGGASWRYADPAHERFSQEIEHARTTVAANVRLEDAAGLVRDILPQGGHRWTFAEYALSADLEKLQQEKREGAGRDPRLSPLPSTSFGLRPLYRVADERMDKGVKPCKDIFEGPSGCTELSSTIATSGLEPQAFAENFITPSGVAPRSGVAAEMKSIIYALFLMECVDQFNLPRSSAAEHLSRRALQLMKAIKKNAKSPDFEGLDAYTVHMDSPGGGAHTPLMDKHVMEAQKTQAFIMKQHRLMKEEEDNYRKSKDKGRAGCLLCL